MKIGHLKTLGDDSLGGSLTLEQCPTATGFVTPHPGEPKSGISLAVPFHTPIIALVPKTTRDHFDGYVIVSRISHTFY
jgi:hypothetical protein